MTKLYSTGSIILYAGQTSCEKKVKCVPYGNIPIKCGNLSFNNPGGIIPPKGVRSVIGSITTGDVPKQGFSGGIAKTYCEDTVNVELFYTRIVGTKGITSGAPSSECSINNVNNNLSCCSPPDNFDCKKTRIPPYFLNNETNGCNYSYSVKSETYSIFYEQVNPEYFCESSLIEYTSFQENVGFAAWGGFYGYVGLPVYNEKCLRFYPEFEGDFGDEACFLAPDFYGKNSKAIYNNFKSGCNTNNIVVNITNANIASTPKTDPPLYSNPYPDYTEISDFIFYRSPILPVDTISCSLESCIEEKIAELLNLGDFLECYNSCKDGTPCPQVVGDGSDKLWYCDGTKCVQPDTLSEDFDPSEYIFGPVSYDTCMKNCPDYDPGRCFPADMRNYMAHRYYEPDGTLLYCCSNEYKEVSDGYLNPSEGCSYPYGTVFQWKQKKEEKLCEITDFSGNPTCLSNMPSNTKIKEYDVCSIGRYNFYEVTRINPKCHTKLYEYTVPGWPYSCDPETNANSGDPPDNCYGVPCPFMKRLSPQYVKEKVAATFEMKTTVYYCEVSVIDCE